MRGLEVLEALAGMQQPARLREIAHRCALSESQAFRVLAALERDAFVSHLGRRGYRVGSRSVALGTLIGPRPVLVRSVQPVIARLALNVGEAVVFHLRSGAHRVLVLRAIPPNARMRELGGVIGERSPLPVGASGRVILAHLPEEEVRRVVPGGTAAERLDHIRTTGYEISLGENHPGINGISSVLLSEEGDPLGSLTIAGEASRLSTDAMVRHSMPLLRACRELGPLVASLLGPDPGATIAALDL